MKIIKSHKQFRGLVRPLMRLEEDVSIEADTNLGFFLPHRLDELRQYCQENPQYHIISYIGDGTTCVNTDWENAGIYRLASGSTDKHLMYVLLKSHSDFLNSIVKEFDVSE